MIGVEQIRISKEEELKLKKQYEEEQAQLKAEREIENQARINNILPKTQQLFRNRSKIGIALKRFIKRNLDSEHFIEENTVFLLRVESKRNGKRYNAVIDYKPYWKNNPYQLHVDRIVPWSRLPHTLDGKWNGPVSVQDKLTNHYKIIEMYPF